MKKEHLPKPIDVKYMISGFSFPQNKLCPSCSRKIPSRSNSQNGKNVLIEF